MTILFFSRLFYPHIGGVEKHALEIGRQMVKDGHRVAVVTENASWDSTETLEGIKIYRINPGKNERLKKFIIWSWLWQNRKLINDADIVHCHDVFFWYLPFRFLFLFKPVYTTFHGYETKFPPSQKSIFIRKISEILSFGNICVGDYISKWYGTKPTYITYGGVKILPINSKTQQLRNKKSKIVFIGRLEQDTGIHMYLQTLEILKQKKFNFAFECVGDGNLRKTAQEYGKVHGFVNNISEYICSADIVFASSYLSVLEAMVSKKSVFALFDNPLKKDYLTLSPFAGFIHITDSPESAASEIMNPDKNAEQKNIDSAYNWAKKQTWDNTARIYYRLWKINQT